MPLAELVGYGATADASHITLPAPGGIGAVRAARRALEKAGMAPDEIDHVNAHATSTPEGDKAELPAIRTIFGDHAPSVAVTANKSMLGHTLGAAGAIEAIATIMALREGCVPPTINLDCPGRARGGARPDAQRRDPAAAARGRLELVRVRRAEHGPRVPAVGRMSAGREQPAREEPVADTGLVEEAGTMEPVGHVEPVAVGPGDPTTADPRPQGEDASLLALVDRFAAVLERSELGELEVTAGGTTIILRAPSAIERPVADGRCPVRPPMPLLLPRPGPPARHPRVRPPRPRPRSHPSRRR